MYGSSKKGLLAGGNLGGMGGIPLMGCNIGMPLPPPLPRNGPPNIGGPTTENQRIQYTKNH